jgi:hypothetical protein
MQEKNDRPIGDLLEEWIIGSGIAREELVAELLSDPDAVVSLFRDALSPSPAGDAYIEAIEKLALQISGRELEDYTREEQDALFELAEKLEQDLFQAMSDEEGP